MLSKASMTAAICIALVCSACKDKPEETESIKSHVAPTLAEKASSDLAAAAKSYQDTAAGCPGETNLQNATKKILSVDGAALSRAIAQDSKHLRDKVAANKAANASPLYSELLTLIMAASTRADSGQLNQPIENSSLQDASQIQAQICDGAKTSLFEAIKRIVLP